MSTSSDRRDDRTGRSWRVGTSGYSYKEWKGPFYPEKLPNAEMLGASFFLKPSSLVLVPLGRCTFRI